MAPRIIVDNRQRLPEVAAELVTEEAQRALSARGRFALAVAGGSVAETLFPRLAASPLPWHDTELFWTDERAVPADHPDSNYGLARRLLLQPAGIPSERVHRMAAERAELEVAARNYQTELLHILGTPPRVDVALLGVGPDGHVASLFPGHPLPDERERWVAPVTDAPKPPPRRLTLTMPALLAARCVVVGAFGTRKAAAVGCALGDPHCESPLAVLLRGAARAVLLLDPEAAESYRSMMR